MDHAYTLLTSPGFTLNMAHYVLRAQEIKDGIILNGNSRLKLYVDSTHALGYVFGAYLSVGISNLSNHRGQVVFRMDEKEGSRNTRLYGAAKEAFNIETKFRDLENSRVEAIMYCKPLAKLLREFDTGVKKHLPQKYLVSNADYLDGVLKGLSDFRGHVQDMRPVLKKRPFSLYVYTLYGFLKDEVVKKD